MAKKPAKETIMELPVSILQTVLEINKKYGKTVLSTLADMPDINIKRIPSGIPKLDEAIGGGFPLGRMVELYGIPSSGKSLIALQVIKQAQKQGLDCIYVDAEGGFDPEFAKFMGVDINKLITLKTSMGEDIFDILAQIEKAEPGVVVVDSVAAMITQTEMDASLRDQQMAIKARLMSKALAKINALNKRSLFLFINQVRETLVLYGQKETTPGGRSLPHYASIRIRVHQGEKLHPEDKKTGEVIGQTIQCSVTKNKTFQPFKDCSFRFYYSDGHFS